MPRGHEEGVSRQSACPNPGPADARGQQGMRELSRPGPGARRGRGRQDEDQAADEDLGARGQRHLYDLPQPLGAQRVGGQQA